jgi:hypothetical protein
MGDHHTVGMHRIPRVAALVLLEYLVITMAICGLLLGVAALFTRKQPRTCGVDNCVGNMIIGMFWEELALYFAGLVIVSLIASLIVMAFRQKRRVRGHPASQETSLFGSASLATAWGFVWGLVASPLTVVALNVLLTSTNAWGSL